MRLHERRRARFWDIPTEKSHQKDQTIELENSKHSRRNTSIYYTIGASDTFLFWYEKLCWSSIILFLEKYHLPRVRQPFQVFSMIKAFTPFFTLPQRQRRNEQDHEDAEVNGVQSSIPCSKKRDTGNVLVSLANKRRASGTIFHIKQERSRSVTCLRKTKRISLVLLLMNCQRRREKQRNAGLLSSARWLYWSCYNGYQSSVVKYRRLLWFILA